MTTPKDATPAPLLAELLAAELDPASPAGVLAAEVARLRSSADEQAIRLDERLRLAALLEEHAEALADGAAVPLFAALLRLW